MALPTTGLTTSAVASAIGEASNDVGALCTSNKINKWSKWKPIRYNKLTGIVEQDLQDVNYGISKHTQTFTPSEVISYNFSYEKPRGGSNNEFFRLGDFRGYNHNAVAPFIKQIPISFYPKFQNYVDIWIKQSESDLNATMLDDYSDMYYAILFFSDNVFIGYMTSTSKITSLNTRIRFGSEFPTNATSFYVCAATEDSVGYSTTINGMLKALPYNLSSESGAAITSSNSFPGTISVIGINKTSSVNYTPIGDLSSTNPFLLDDSGTVNLVVEIKPTVNINLHSLFFKLYARPTFASGAVTPYKTGVLDATPSEIIDGTLSGWTGYKNISGGTTTILLLSVANFMRYYEGEDMGSMDSAKKAVTFYIQYNSILMETIVGNYLEYV